MRIIYQEAGQQLVVRTPFLEGCPIEIIGCKDVPQGVPFWIVPESTIPKDRTFRDAWELDSDSLGQPSGYGDYSKFEQWLSERGADE